MPDDVGPLTYDEFEALVAKVFLRERSLQREGQHFCNLLDHMRKDIAVRLRGSELDPFYWDYRLPAAREFVKRVWDEPFAVESGVGEGSDLELDVASVEADAP